MISRYNYVAGAAAGVAGENDGRGIVGTVKEKATEAYVETLRSTTDGFSLVA